MAATLLMSTATTYVADDHLNVMDNLAVKNVVAMTDEVTQQAQSLFLGASKDVTIEASQGMIMNLGSSNELVINDASDVASLKVQTDASTTTLTAVQKDLRLTTADNSNLSVFVAGTEVSQSNDYQKISTVLPSGFYFDDELRTSGNALVEKSVAVGGNIVCNESLYGRDYNLIKHLTPSAPTDPKMVGYSFAINASNQLELLKHVTFSNGGKATKKVGIFGLNMLSADASESWYDGFDGVSSSNYLNPGTFSDPVTFTAPAIGPAPIPSQFVSTKSTVNGGLASSLYFSNQVWTFGQRQYSGAGYTSWSTTLLGLTNISGFGSLANNTIVGSEVASFGGISIVVDSSGRPHAWGYDLASPTRNNYGDASGYPKLLGGWPEGKRIVDYTGLRSNYADTLMMLDDEGTMYGLGSDGWYGLLGTGTTNNTRFSAPTPVSSYGSLAGKRAKRVFGGVYTFWALDADDQLHAWGEGWAGQYGDGGTTDSMVPVAVTLVGSLAGKKVKEIIGGTYVLAIDQNNDLHMWNGSQALTPPSVPALFTAGSLAGKKFTQVVTQNYMDLGGMALDTDGHVHAWGRANSANPTSTVPEDMMAYGSLVGKTIVSISINADGTMFFGLDSTNALHAWGDSVNKILTGNPYDSTLVQPTTLPRDLQEQLRMEAHAKRVTRLEELGIPVQQQESMPGLSALPSIIAP